jgi:hypothetical protein
MEIKHDLDDMEVKHGKIAFARPLSGSFESKLTHSECSSVAGGKRRPIVDDHENVVTRLA